MKVLFWMSTGFQTTSRHLLISILKSLCGAGHDVTVLQKATGNDIGDLPEELNGLHIVNKSVKIGSPKKTNLALRYIYDAMYVWKCKKHITDEYEAVFVQSTNIAGFSVYWIKRKDRKARITLNVQDIFPYNAAFSGKINRNGILFKMLSKVQRYAYKNSDQIITISEDMRDTLIEDGANASKIKVIYNWSYMDTVYDHNQIDFTGVSHIFDKSYFNVVYAGNVGVMQNVDVIIEAANLMKENKDVWFHIIGNGVYKEKLKGKAEQYGITNISFWPMLSSQLAPAVYASADVNVIPLVKEIYKTALPSKTATCFACGKPIIFCFGKKSLFAQQAQKITNCINVESDDAEGLKEAILTVRNLPTAIGYEEFFAEHLQKKKNSERYAEIISGVQG